MEETEIGKARAALREAEALVITAGAGMGVDSGLPDFRGNEGFWGAYPPYRKLGVSFEEMANPAHFARDPAFAWGFYGHRLDLYRHTEPHAGYVRLLGWARTLRGGCFVFTSNVDGHFQRAGFAEEQVVECHGSIHYLQCVNACSGDIWGAEGAVLATDSETMRAREPLPVCPRCGGLARPNILMFGDWAWNGRRTAAQEERLVSWLRGLAPDARLAILEFGAGTAVPTVRMRSERLAAAMPKAFLVRVNPRAPEVPAGVEGIGLAAGAADAIRRLLDGEG